MNLPGVAPFYNRDRERAALHQAIQSSRAELLILYGRRGVGKREAHLFLFARSGFSEHLHEIAANQEPRRLHLIGLEELYAL